MNVSALIETSKTEGVNFEVSRSGGLKLFGKKSAVEKWTGIIREHRNEILSELSRPNVAPTIGTVAATSAGDEGAIRRWLSGLGETDAQIIDEVMERCRTDSEALAYYLRRAKQKKQRGSEPEDDRRSCLSCAELRGGCCMAARRGEINATRNYRPSTDIPRRCGHYLPRADELDQRTGKERWAEFGEEA